MIIAPTAIAEQARFHHKHATSGRPTGVDEPTVRAQLDDPLSLIARLRADVDRLVAENISLRDRVADLEAELAKNSQDSSRPPSADPIEPRGSGPRRAEARDAGPPARQTAGAARRREPDPPETRCDRRASPGVCASCGPIWLTPKWSVTWSAR